MIRSLLMRDLDFRCGSLNKAMQIINSLSLEGNKLVGIISHVDELKDQIDQKIEVYKDHAGSKIKRNCKFL